MIAPWRKLWNQQRDALRSYAYLLLEWGTSGVAFLSMVLVYRASGAEEVGLSAWYLNFLSTMLSIAVAIQYYTMIRGRSALSAYVSFLPAAVIQLLLVYPFLSSGHWLLTCVIVALTLFYQAFRGQLMASGRLVIASCMNMGELLLRLICFLLATEVLQMEVTGALLSSILFTYIVTSSLSFLFWWRGYRTRPVFNSWRDTTTYILMYFGIYLLTAVDVLSLKGHGAMQDHMGILKPWGTMIYTLSIPFFNLFLTRLREKKPVKPIFLGLGLLYLFYSMFSYVFSPWLSLHLFGHLLPSRNHLLMVIGEHISLSLFVTLLHFGLYQEKRLKELLLLCGVASLSIYGLSQAFTEGWNYMAYLLIFLLAAGAAAPLLLGRVKKNDPALPKAQQEGSTVGTPAEAN